MPFGHEEVLRARSKKALREATLVLDASSIAYAIEASRFGGARLLVGTMDGERARTEVSTYAEENIAWPRAKDVPPPKLTDGMIGAGVFGALIVAMFLLERQRSFGVDWWSSGLVHAESIRNGEIWRTITALTLHADTKHLIGNLVFGGLFGVVAAQTLGTGITWLGTLLAGLGGNWIEAWLVEPSHRGIGASTAIFGTLGLMVAAEWTRRGSRRLPWVRRVAPLFAGAVIFGWVGAGGGDTSGASRVDVLAHALGFAVGAVLGVIVSRLKLTERVTPRQQTLLAVAAALSIVAAWTVAITAN